MEPTTGQSYPIKSFRDLVVWQKAMRLCEAVYTASAEFPDAERYGLTSQIRRAAVSVPSNMAEGYGRNRTKDYLRYLRIARGSLYELETQLLLAARLHFADADHIGPCGQQIAECDRMLNALERAIRDGRKSRD
jgi:four helix bundle protein